MNLKFASHVNMHTDELRTYFNIGGLVEKNNEILNRAKRKKTSKKEPTKQQMKDIKEVLNLVK